MNEILFFIQILIITGFTLGALRLGEGALVGWVSIQALIANLFVLKQITLFGFEVTASDAYAIGSLLGLNFLQEFYDKEAAKKATLICFFFMFFFTIVSQLHLLYIPSPHDMTQEAFLTLLTPSPRLLSASMAVFFIVQRIDINIFEFLKKSLPQTGLAIRASISLVFSQFLDTLLFSFLGLYGLVNSLIDVILISFLIKLIIIGCSALAIRWVKT